MPDTTNSGNPFNWRADGGGVIDEDHAQAIDRAVTDLGLAFGNLRRRFDTDAPAKQA